MSFIKKAPYLYLWLSISLIRITFLLMHFFRLDPYGMPIVARVDRFLPFSILVEIGSIALLIAPFALISKKFKGAISWASTLSIIYLIWGLFDLETYRFLKQHITLSFIQNYVKLSSLNDSTLLLSLESDPLGNFIFLCSLCLLILLFIFKSKVIPRDSSHWLETIILILISGFLATSLHWLNPSHNRHNRLNTPLHIIGNEIKNLIASKYQRPSIKSQKIFLKQFIQIDSNRTKFLPEYPFVNRPIEEYCYGKSSTDCLIDFDKDGFSRNVDCNDFDSDIFPGNLELKSDGIDQDCSGVDETPMNIILIVGESFNQKVFMKEFKENNHLKQFKRMANLGGKLFPNTFSNGFPSVYGAASIYLGIWNHPHQSILGEFTAKHFKGFPEFLSSKYYQKTIVSGADPYFDNQAFWFNRFYDKVIYDKNNGLGTYNADEVVFSKAIESLQKRDKNKSFLLTINNHSTHTPFRYPKNYKPNWKTNSRIQDFSKALDYFDTQLGSLLDYMTNEKLLKNTVFLLVGDHGMAITPEDFQLPEFYGFEKSQTVSGIFSGSPHLFKDQSSRFQIDSSVVSQIDIAPTVLSIAGIHTTHHFLGQDLLKEKIDKRPALFFKNGAISIHSSNHTTYSHLDMPGALFLSGNREKKHSQSIISSSKGLAHLTHFLIYENKIWNPQFTLLNPNLKMIDNN